MRIKIEESTFLFEKMQRERYFSLLKFNFVIKREETQKTQQIKTVDFQFYEEIKEKFQKFDQLIKYFAQEKLDAQNEKSLYSSKLKFIDNKNKFRSFNRGNKNIKE